MMKKWRAKIQEIALCSFVRVIESKTFLMNKLRNRQSTKPSILGERIVILGNGPSQNLYWRHRDKFKDFDLLCVNFFPVKYEELFLDVKPQYICLSDPLLFRIRVGLEERYQEYKNDIEELWNIIDKIDWNCKLICMNYFEIPKLNNYISVIKLTSVGILFKDYKRLYKVYLKNLIKPYINGVVGDAIYFSLIFGYKEIGLFGADSNSLWDMRVDENNEIVWMDRHNYGTKERKLKKETKNGLHHELKNQYYYFKSFYELSLLADIIDCKITNYCVESFIDVFTKQRLEI